MSFGGEEKGEKGGAFGWTHTHSSLTLLVLMVCCVRRRGRERGERRREREERERRERRERGEIVCLSPRVRDYDEKGTLVQSKAFNTPTQRA